MKNDLLIRVHVDITISFIRFSIISLKLVINSHVLPCLGIKSMITMSCCNQRTQRHHKLSIQYLDYNGYIEGKVPSLKSFMSSI